MSLDLSVLSRFKALLSSKPTNDSTCIEIGYVKYPIFQVSPGVAFGPQLSLPPGTPLYCRFTHSIPPTPSRKPDSSHWRPVPVSPSLGLGGGEPKGKGHPLPKTCKSRGSIPKSPVGYSVRGVFANMGSLLEPCAVTAQTQDTGAGLGMENQRPSQSRGTQNEALGLRRRLEHSRQREEHVKRTYMMCSSWPCWKPRSVPSPSGGTPQGLHSEMV